VLLPAGMANGRVHIRARTRMGFIPIRHRAFHCRSGT
jgi:hypothetical protein